jgi:hypothetical protein
MGGGEEGAKSQAGEVRCALLCPCDSDDDDGDGTKSGTGEHHRTYHGHPLPQAAYRSVRIQCQLDSDVSPESLCLPRLSNHGGAPRCEPHDVTRGGAGWRRCFERRRGREGRINDASIQVQWQLLRPETTAWTTRVRGNQAVRGRHDEPDHERLTRSYLPASLASLRAQRKRSRQVSRVSSLRSSGYGMADTSEGSECGIHVVGQEWE